MNLKEAFRYQNKLSDFINSGVFYLNKTENVTKRTETHMRSKARKEEPDETIEVQSSKETGYNANDVMDMLEQFIDEKEKVSNAIDTAKSCTKINIDAELSTNKARQMCAATLNGMSSIKATEVTTRGTSYAFDVNGVQAPYYYDVRHVTTIDFDRDKAKAIAKKLLLASDNVSNEVDRIMVESNVDFTPKFDINDTFEDIMDSI